MIDCNASVYRPANTLVMLLSVMFIGYTVLALMAAGSDFMEIELLSTASISNTVSDSEIGASELRQGFIALLRLGLLMTLMIVFCCWIYRANANARALGADDMNFTPGWSVGWFFVPFMNLFKPFKVMKEIWQASSPNIKESWQVQTVSALVPAWWALWLLSQFTGQAATRMSFNASSFDQLSNASTVMLVSDCIDIPLSIVILMIIRGIHDNQQRRHHNLMQQPVDSTQPMGRPIAA